MSANRSHPEPPRFGDRVCSTTGPQQGALSAVTSILTDRDETDDQVTLDSPPGAGGAHSVVSRVRGAALEAADTRAWYDFCSTAMS